MYKLLLVDCLDRMKELEDNSIDSIVTDPPYGLSFMGAHWDKGVPGIEFWTEMLRILKPGGHLLSFGGSRTYHRMASAIEDAGFEIRDQIMWVYGSGFPKSHDISKGIDKLLGLGDKREITHYKPQGTKSMFGGGKPRPASLPASQWRGFGTALKPAHEPIVLAKKPFKGTVANNVLRHGVGGLNIDGCRVEGEPPSPRNALKKIIRGGAFHSGSEAEKEMSRYNPTQGRWPANLIHDGSEEVLDLFPQSKGQQGDLKDHYGERESPNGIFGKMAAATDHPKRIETEKSAARFFYCAKTSKSDRNSGCLNIEEKQYSHDGRQTTIDNAYQRNSSNSSNNHPTIKPTDLMRYLCRLITPPNGVILDPFMGSGSTGKAAAKERFYFIGIEQDENYFNIAKARIDYAYGADLC